MRGNDGLGQGKSSGSGEKWSDFYYILQLTLTGFADEQDMEWEKMRGVKLDISEQLEGWTLVCNNRITWQRNQARYKLDLYV